MTKYILEVIFFQKINLEPLEMETWNPPKERGFKFLFQKPQTKHMEKELETLKVSSSIPFLHTKHSLKVCPCWSPYTAFFWNQFVKMTQIRKDLHCISSRGLEIFKDQYPTNL